MSLEMKPACLRCAAALPPDGPAFVCSYECTFCEPCAASLARVCPNCSGELVPRPRRVAKGARPRAPFTLAEGGFSATDDPARLDLDFIHAYLARSYWSKGIPKETVARAAANSIAFGVYGPNDDGRAPQVGFGRVITDRATFAYLSDVFIIEAMRGCGLSTLLMRAILAHPHLQGLRRWMLVTKDAHALYERFGFRPLESPQNVLGILHPGVYADSSGRQGIGID